jgi:hypothetical protein
MHCGRRLRCGQAVLGQRVPFGLHLRSPMHASGSSLRPRARALHTHGWARRGSRRWWDERWRWRRDGLRRCGREDRRRRRRSDRWGVGLGWRSKYGWLGRRSGGRGWRRRGRNLVGRRRRCAAGRCMGAVHGQRGLHGRAHLFAASSRPRRTRNVHQAMPERHYGRVRSCASGSRPSHVPRQLLRNELPLSTRLRVLDSDRRLCVLEVRPPSRR